MEARGKSVSNAGVIGFLTLCVIMASCLFTPAMGEETDSASILTDLAVVKNVTFTRKGKSDVVAVFLDRPFIYSYYPLSDPPRGVIDLAQSDPGAYLEPISYQGGQVKQLRFIKEDLGSGQLTRLEFLLQDNADFIVRSSPEDNLKLVITFSGGGEEFDDSGFHVPGSGFATSQEEAGSECPGYSLQGVGERSRCRVKEYSSRG